MTAELVCVDCGLRPVESPATVCGPCQGVRLVKAVEDYSGLRNKPKKPKEG